MPKRTSTHKLKMHQKKLKKVKDAKREEGPRQIQEKTVKQKLVTEVWDYKNRQLAREKYPAFLAHMKERMREDPNDLERAVLKRCIEEVEREVTEK